MANRVNVIIHHGEMFLKQPGLKYVGGSVHEVEDIDIDYMNIPDIQVLLRKELRYNSYKSLYYRVPKMEFDTSIRLLQCDDDVRDMLGYLERLKESEQHIYVEHGVDEAVVVEDVERDEELHGSEGHGEGMYEEAQHDSDSSISMYEVGVEYDSTDSEDVSLDDENDSNEGDSDGSNDSAVGVNAEGDSDGSNDSTVGVNAEGDYFEGFEGELPRPEEVYADSSDLESLPDSENEETTKPNQNHLPSFKPPKDIRDTHFELGQTFTTHIELREAIKNYAIAGGYPIKFTKNARSKIIAKCDVGCDFRLYASYIQDDPTLQIKSLILTHKCSRQFSNPQVSSRWLAKRYLDKIRTNPSIGLVELQNTVKMDYVVNISRVQAYRAKRKALEMIHGNQDRQFTKCYDYCAALLRSNHGSTAKVLADVPSVPKGIPIFQRIYVCLAACKRGFVNACRPFVGVDACFLKGAVGGLHLMAAVGRDPNEQMFPIAWAVAEGETIESWTWFFQLLFEDIGLPHKKIWTFMSDQQKGLDIALKEVAPNAEHRNCVRHIYNNFAKKYKGKHLKKAMWRAAKACNEADFSKKMDELKGLDEKAHNHMAALETNSWNRCGFTPRCKVNSLVNNMSESFNQYIMFARDKPILACLEIIREMLMQRMQARRLEIEKHAGFLTPNVQTKLECRKEQTRDCIPIRSSPTLFEVKQHPDRYVVDLAARTCTCRKWKLSGIPCCHAISCIFYIRQAAEDYVDSWYTTEKWKSCYEPIMYPVVSERFWPKSNFPALAPPIITRQPGRPKIQRMRDPEEAVPTHKMSRKNVKLKCTKCKQYGHNHRTCKGVDPNTKSKGCKIPVKRKRREPAAAETSQQTMGGDKTNPIADSGRRKTTQPTQTANEGQSSGTQMNGSNWNVHPQPAIFKPNTPGVEGAVFSHRPVCKTRARAKPKSGSKSVKTKEDDGGNQRSTASKSLLNASMSKSQLQNPTRWYGEYLSPYG